MPNWTAGKEYEQPPVGTTIGRCIRLIDIGTQHGEWKGKPKSSRQCIIVWELPYDLMKEGDYAGFPFTVSEFYTQSIGDKAKLGIMLQAWRGKEFTQEERDGFNPENILGKTCTLALARKPNGKVRVSTVSPVMKGVTVPSQVNPSVYFMLDKFDQATFDGLSNGIRELVEKSDEYQALKGNKPAAPSPAPSGTPQSEFVDDEIPF